MNRTICCLALLASLVQAQDAPSAEPGRQRPVPPLFKALDTNQDGVISATELANAAASLKKLDLNGDGRLTPDEYRPPRPDGAAPRAAAPPPGPEGQTRPKDTGQQPPRPLIDTALDEDGDEIISAAEIARAPMLLKKLDANGDGRLTMDECLPKRPMSRTPQGGSGQ